MAKIDLQPVFEYLDIKFGEIREQFRYINEQFDEVMKRFVHVDERLDTMTNALDANLKLGKDNNEELIVSKNKVDEHELRISKVEGRLGIEFKH